MNHSIVIATHHCGCCKQELPIEAFYISQRTQHPDNYCKECRKKVSRKQRKRYRSIQIVEKPRSYPVITEIKDSDQRMRLLLHSLQMVAESIKRKRRKRWEKEDEGFIPYEKSCQE